MSTIERVRGLRRKFDIVTKAEGQQVSLEHLRELTEQLEGPLDGLERHLGRCRGLGLSLEGHRRKKLSEKLERLSTQYLEAPQEVGQGTIFADLKDGVIDAVKALRSSADQQWEERRSKVLDDVPRGLLEFWESVPDLADSAGELQKDLAALETKSSPPADERGCEAFLQVCTQIEDRIEKLMEFEAPESVRRFVTAAASSRGASWQSLTDEVRSWLSENEMLEKLRFRL